MASLKSARCWKTQGSMVCLLMLTLLFTAGCGVSFEAGIDMTDGTIADLRADANLHSRMLRMTRGVRIPDNATGIYVCHDNGSVDVGDYLVFQTDKSGAEAFVQGFCGKPVDELPARPSMPAHCNYPTGLDSGFPWNPLDLDNVRYYEDPPVFLAVDVDRHKIYLMDAF